jgi:CrcB protein
MNQLIAIALGGAFGAVMRFLVSSGVYNWLGRDFPYGTLVVNVIGSFLLGLSIEALIVQRIVFAADYRAAILVGFIGAFTTFSTFSLETVILIEQDAFAKALLNIFASVLICLFAVSLGLMLGRILFLYNGGILQWRNAVFPYGTLSVNALVAFLFSLVASVLLQKATLSAEHFTIIITVSAGLYVTLSGLYVLLHLLERGYSISHNGVLLVTVFAGNTILSILAMAVAFWTAKQV